MKKLLLITLCLMLLASSALAQVKKSEVVYAKLDAQGQVKGVYIVNGFEALEAAEITDYGSYTQIMNLSSLDALSEQDGALKLSLSPGRFYYQGDPQSQTLPWDVRMTYKLDGKDMPPEDLSGAAGQLEIALAITVNEAMKAYAQAMTLQVSLTLDGDRSLNIAAPGGTIASAAGNKTVAYVVLPGQSVNYTLAADVHDFMMPGVQIAGIRLVMDVAQYQAVAEQSMAGTPLAQAAGPMLQNLLGSMQGGLSTSFADPRNGTIDSLQFVLMGDGIPEKEKPPMPQTQTQEEPQGILNRFLALFGM